MNPSFEPTLLASVAHKRPKSCITPLSTNKPLPIQTANYDSLKNNQSHANDIWDTFHFLYPIAWQRSLAKDIPFGVFWNCSSAVEERLTKELEKQQKDSLLLRASNPKDLFANIA
eukprot:1760399-Amphidinium_carterae.1